MVIQFVISIYIWLQQGLLPSAEQHSTLKVDMKHVTQFYLA